MALDRKSKLHLINEQKFESKYLLHNKQTTVIE